MRGIIRSEKTIKTDTANKVAIVKTDDGFPSSITLEKLLDPRLIRLEVKDEKKLEAKIIFWSSTKNHVDRRMYTIKTDDCGSLILSENNQNLFKSPRTRAIEIDKKLDFEFNRFTDLKTEINDNFIAFTFIEKDKNAISFQKNFNEMGFIFHIIGGYIDNDGTFTSEGKIEMIETLNVDDIIQTMTQGLKKNHSSKNKMRVKSSTTHAW